MTPYDSKHRTFYAALSAMPAESMIPWSIDGARYNADDEYQRVYRMAVNRLLQKLPTRAYRTVFDKRFNILYIIRMRDRIA